MNPSDYPYLSRETLHLQSEASNPSSSRFRQLLDHLWQGFLQWAARQNEPKIHQRFDRQGRSKGWEVFDHHTGKTATLGSELEVRQWLEQRYR